MTSIVLTLIGLGCILIALMKCDMRAQYSVVRYPLAICGALLVCVAIVMLP
jgi:hypothetical protein